MPTPAIVWFRLDLRLADNPALQAAVKHGGAVIPVFIHDPEAEALGNPVALRIGGCTSRWKTSRNNWPRPGAR